MHVSRRMFFIYHHLVAGIIISVYFITGFSANAPLTSPPALQQRQLENIIDALIGSGDFASWASFLSTADPATLPLTATFLIPVGVAPDAPHFFLPYHVIPQRLDFSSLLRLSPLSRLPTLLPDKTILLTNASHSNFTLDDSLVTHPDLYLSSAAAVHGLRSVLDYTVYGDTGAYAKSSNSASSQAVSMPPLTPSVSKAAKASSPAVFLLRCLAFAFKVQTLGSLASLLASLLFFIV